MYELDDILALLDRFHQRATYGAVAGCVGGIARGVMAGRVKYPRNSWEVLQATRLPAGFLPEELHSALRERKNVVTDANKLSTWLRSPR